ncbi:MAG: hypothetical protein ACWA44_15390 [Thiotrichales bacterium]
MTSAIDEFVAKWVDLNPFTPEQVDCATAVMLKILDGKCKMSPEEKRVMQVLYDAVKQYPGKRFGKEIHELISSSAGVYNEAQRMNIHEKRVFAESTIPRPEMKSFKGMIRKSGLFINPVRK